MTEELDTLVADTAGSLAQSHAAVKEGPCANCGTELQGPWCHACGQRGEDFHRSLPHLLIEVIEGIFHFDGRFWHTVPALAWKPARLTNDFLTGHRAPQIPPFRLFLIVLLLVFVTGPIIASASQGVRVEVIHDGHVITGPQADAEAAQEFAKAQQDIQTALPAPVFRVVDRIEGWFEPRLKNASADREKFNLILEQWGERFAFLLLPMVTLLLALLFVTKREFFMFDHAVFALHSLSALGLLLCVVFVLHRAIGAYADWLLLLAPVHVFSHMRGVYRTGIAGTLLRMAVLGVGSAVGFELILAGLITVGLSGMGG